MVNIFLLTLASVMFSLIMCILVPAWIILMCGYLLNKMDTKE